VFEDALTKNSDSVTLGLMLQLGQFLSELAVDEPLPAGVVFGSKLVDLGVERGEEPEEGVHDEPVVPDRVLGELKRLRLLRAQKGEELGLAELLVQQLQVLRRLLDMEHHLAAGVLERSQL